MQYRGKLYGKIGRRQIPLAMTSDDVDKLVSDNQELIVQHEMRMREVDWLKMEITRLESLLAGKSNPCDQP